MRAREVWAGTAAGAFGHGLPGEGMGSRSGPVGSAPWPWPQGRISSREVQLQQSVAAATAMPADCCSCSKRQPSNTRSSESPTRIHPHSAGRRRLAAVASHEVRVRHGAPPRRPFRHRRRPFRHEAQGARPGSAPRRAWANPGGCAPTGGLHG